jgi:hypothetical protein
VFTFQESSASTEQLEKQHKAARKGLFRMQCPHHRFCNNLFAVVRFPCLAACSGSVREAQRQAAAEAGASGARAPRKGARGEPMVVSVFCLWLCVICRSCFVGFDLMDWHLGFAMCSMQAQKLQEKLAEVTRKVWKGFLQHVCSSVLTATLSLFTARGKARTRRRHLPQVAATRKCIPSSTMNWIYITNHHRLFGCRLPSAVRPLTPLVWT